MTEAKKAKELSKKPDTNKLDSEKDFENSNADLEAIGLTPENEPEIVDGQVKINKTNLVDQEGNRITPDRPAFAEFPPKTEIHIERDEKEDSIKETLKDIRKKIDESDNNFKYQITGYLDEIISKL